METEVTLQIILTKPTPGVIFGLQKGSGSNYETVQKQSANNNDLLFSFPVNVKGDHLKDKTPTFSGSYVQGPRDSRFIYIDIGTYAGQTGTIWSRRLKVPLTGITWKDVDRCRTNLHSILETRVPGTGKDGGPNCATVKPFDGWHYKNA